MEISCSELFYLISKIYPLVKVGKSQSDPIIERVRIFRGQKIEHATLYVVDCSKDAAHQKAFVSPAIASADAVLLCGEGVSERLESTAIRKMKESGVVLVCEDGISAESIIEQVSDSLLEVERWDNLLKEASFIEPSTKMLVRAGEALIPELLGVVDPEMNIIVPTKRGSDTGRETTFLKEDGSLRVATAIAEDLLIDDDYERAVGEIGVFLYPFRSDRAIYICANIFSGSTFCARIVSDLPQRLSEFGLRGLTGLFAHFVTHMRRCFLGEYGNDEVTESRENARRILRQILEDPSKVSPDRVLAIASDCSWPMEGTFLVSKAQFFEGSYWSSMANFLRVELEQLVKGSNAATSGNEVIWICSLDAELQADDSSLYEKLAYVVRDYTCKMGISRHVSGVENIIFGIREAHLALELGQRKDPHYWYYRFKDYISLYLFDRMTGELPIDQLVHPGLEKIAAYDERHGTEYLPTLRLYFDCGYNVSRAAEDSFVHRTTFSRRLDRIKNIAGVDPHDPKMRLDLILSFWILDKLGESKETTSPTTSYSE